ncbi:unnamed protein product [Trifolium pratense]|uniref:Uncharacterized protein n=1 Tax=Trifolium pratense TaxID=57577 RepID=A0ACB0IBQ4_TRIPR|nr:unnamed protein product [Trifolium pratense]
MQTPVLDPQDQSIEDSTAMTIEFLRARLLSERSISRSARQRTDELEKRVLELEEQLRTVTLQRKMAEKATADVLAILEDRGISDLSEELDSGSDLDIPCESGVSNESSNSKEGEERYTSSKGRHNGSDEPYDSHMDSTPEFNTSLCWKGRHDSPRSLEKYKSSNMRRQNSFSPVSSSPKHNQGKSCRKIRHRQSRSVGEESKDKSVNGNFQENEFVFSSEGYPKLSVAGSNIPRIESKIPEENESEVNLVNKNHHVDIYDKEDMEKALEHQARLIDRFEAMEKAQRQWEEKFRENNSSTTPDSCDPGNHSDMTEDKEESKDQILYSSKAVTSNAQEDKSERGIVNSPEEILKSEARDVMPKSYDTRAYTNHNNTTLRTSDLLGQENSHSPLNGNQNERSVNRHYQSTETKQDDARGHGYPGSKPSYSFPTDSQVGLHQNDASRNKSDRYALVSREKSHEFNGVLESLKQAKISLQQQLNRLPLVESSKAITPSAIVAKSEGRFDIPVGFSGLFRVPTDFTDEATSRFGVHDSTGGFGANFYHNNRGISRTYDSQFVTKPYYGTTMSLSANDQSHGTRYLENGPVYDSIKPPFDPFSNGGPPYSGKQMYPSFPIKPSYQMTSPQMEFGGELSRPYPVNPSYQLTSPQMEFGGELSRPYPINPSYQITSPQMEFGGELSRPYPINPSYQITSPQMEFGGKLSRPYSSRTAGVPLADRFSFNGDHLK